MNCATAVAEDRTKTAAGDSDLSSTTESSTINIRDTINIRELAAWILMVVFAVMFFVSVTGNILVLWVYKKRQAGNNCNVLSSKYEMESNYCYEATAMKQTRDTCL